MNQLIKIVVILAILNMAFGLFVWLIKQGLFLMLVTTIVYTIYVAIFPKKAPKFEDCKVS